ncbi:MAG: hypothetical protein QOI20_3026, partial [Acidimicrobiaceae bacterium]|nr:hypothetical protein [Acidimicrobiaceae bacterium]
MPDPQPPTPPDFSTAPAAVEKRERLLELEDVHVHYGKVEALKG